MTDKKTSPLGRFPDYTATIGIEVHTQLKTKSKLFCSCPNKFGEEPNTNICPTCAGHPGSLPVLNRKVIDYAIMAGLATNCSIAKIFSFARKHYPYPDLPKNFQITQGEKPICSEGYVPINLPDGKVKKIRLIRIHIEEDAGKSIHATQNESFVDLNRAGTPLLEMVSYPDINSSEEARTYLMRLRTIIQYLGISDANMEEGSFRADTNISVKKKDATELGTRVELKNINSFKFIAQAINHEIIRQIELIEDGGNVIQETRLWDPKMQKTIPMRTKEHAEDYRYFTEPDIPVVMVDEGWIEGLQKNIPELPYDKFHRFQKQYHLSAYEADILISQKDLAQFFEDTVKECNKPKQVSNWMLRNLLAYLNEKKMTLTQSQITPETLAELINVIEQGIINTKVAQDVFLEMAETGKYPSIVIQEKDLKQITSPEELEKIVLEIIAKNPETVAQYRAGNDRLFMFFVGQAMKATKGKGSPAVIQELFKQHLE